MAIPYDKLTLPLLFTRLPRCARNDTNNWGRSPISRKARKGAWPLFHVTASEARQSHRDKL